MKQWKLWAWVLTLKQRAVPCVGAVEGTGAALLAAAIGAGHEAEQGQHLSDGDGGTHGGEVDGGTWDSAWRLLLFVPGLPQLFAAFAGLGELAVALGMDGLVVAEQAVVGCDVADGTVQADVVVMLHVVGDDAAGILERQRHLDADAIALEGFVPAFDLAVVLRIVRSGADMGHAGDANEFLEVLGDELGAVVGDDAWRDAGVTSPVLFAGWFPRRFPPFSRGFPSER